MASNNSFEALHKNKMVITARHLQLMAEEHH